MALERLLFPSERGEGSLLLFKRGKADENRLGSAWWRFDRGGQVKPGLAAFSVTRATVASCFDSSGTLRSAASGVARFTYSPSTLAALGLLMEEQATNSIRNNTMVGAVAGTPGTLPTNWSDGFSGTPINGISRNITAVTSETGITYIGYRLSGTATATFAWNLFTEAANVIAAANGQTWTTSVYQKLGGGTLTGIATTKLIVAEYNSTPTLLTTSEQAFTATSSGIATQRVSLSRTFNQATTAYARQLIQINITNGAVVDMTLFIGLPQLEQEAGATSVIETTSAAVTRNADVNSSTVTTGGQGTVVISARTAGFTAPAGAAQTLWSWDDGTTNNRIVINRNASNQITAFVINGGATQFNVACGSVANDTAFKVALAWAANDFEAIITSGTAQTDTSGTLPTVTTRRIGHAFSLTNQWNSTIERVNEYPHRLSSAQLAALVA